MLETIVNLLPELIFIFINSGIAIFYILKIYPKTKHDTTTLIFWTVVFSISGLGLIAAMLIHALLMYITSIFFIGDLQIAIGVTNNYYKQLWKNNLENDTFLSS